MANKKQYIEILNAALSTGADFAELFYENRISKGVSLENGKVENAATANSHGVGIRLLLGLKSVYGYTNDTSHKAVLQLASSLANSFEEKRQITVEKLINKKVQNLHPVEISYKNTSLEEIVNYLKPAGKLIKDFDKKIIRSKVNLSCSCVENTIINSDGYIFKNYKEFGRVGIIAVANEEERFETGYESAGSMSGFEFFINKTDINSLAEKAAKAALIMLTAKDCPSGKMPVVIANGNGGVLFHEACGHPLEASSVSKNLSVFSNKLGEQIASKIVNAVDDGTLPNEWGSNNIDDEGNKTQRTVLIENGILKNYLIDNFNGRRMNTKGNGACRRESYRYEPTSRMSNTFICNGESTPEEIIKSIKLGLYAKTLSGGSVNPSTGEFNFGCSEAYIIRNGEIAEPVRGASLIGSGKEILMNIDMVGNDLDLSQGYCGAASGSIPVDVGQPTIRISEITVGGNGGELK